MSDAVVVAMITAIPVTIAAIGGFIVMVRKVKAVEEKVDTNTAITTQTSVIATETRELADGRLTKMVSTVDDLTAKLAASESNVARLVATEVGKASSEVLMRAQDVVGRAEATAVSLLGKAEERAVALLAEARREADNPPPRRRQQ